MLRADDSEASASRLRKIRAGILDAKIHDRRLTTSERLTLRNGGELAKDTIWPQLRGAAWLGWVLAETGWTWGELKVAVGADRERSSLVDRWKTGDTTPKGASVGKLAEEVPGSRELYELPLWQLLANYPRSARECKRALAAYIDREAPIGPYRYPDLLGLGEQWYAFEPAHREDSDTMRMRGDIYAFTTLVALVREAEAECRDLEHSYHLANLYRMLPALSRIGYLYSLIPSIAGVIEALRWRVPYSRQEIGVDWRVLDYQIKSADYSPLTPLRPHYEMGDELELDIDPIIYFDGFLHLSIGSTGDLARTILHR